MPWRRASTCSPYFLPCIPLHAWRCLPQVQARWHFLLRHAHPSLPRFSPPSPAFIACAGPQGVLGYTNLPVPCVTPPSCSPYGDPNLPDVAAYGCRSAQYALPDGRRIIAFFDLPPAPALNARKGVSRHASTPLPAVVALPLLAFVSGAPPTLPITALTPVRLPHTAVRTAVCDSKDDSILWEEQKDPGACNTYPTGSHVHPPPCQPNYSPSAGSGWTYPPHAAEDMKALPLGLLFPFIIQFCYARRWGWALHAMYTHTHTIPSQGIRRRDPFLYGCC